MSSETSSNISLAVAVISEKRFAVDLKNKTGQTLKGYRVSIDTPGIIDGKSEKDVAPIAPESSVRVEFKLKEKVSHNNRSIKISASFPGKDKKEVLNTNLRAVLVTRVAKPLVIDGDLSDWASSIPVLTLDRRNVDPKSRSPRWSKKEDQIKAELRYAWNDNYLYTAVTVYKQDFYPLKDKSNYINAWKQDCIQICYDTLRNAKAGATELGDDDFEYCLVMCDGTPLVTRRWASSAIHDSLPKNSGIVDSQEVMFAVQTHADRVVYEMAFPKRSVSPFKLYPYSVMRTGLIVNINNGKERMGWLELTPGVGQYPKRPDQWIDLVLLPSAGK